MANISEYDIPVLDMTFELDKHDYPISPGENLMRAFHQEKPLWMPNILGDGQMTPRPNTDDNTPGENYVFKNWFGVGFQYSEIQGSPTPLIPVISEVKNWEKELKFPNLDDYDLGKPDPDFVRDPDKLLFCWVPSSGFQELFGFEPFEQALIDMITEPDACRELFEALVDFNIKVFDLTNSAYHYDYAVYADDWGTMRAPFFSPDLMRSNLLAPTRRYIRHMQDAGVKIMFHNCGMIDAFLPAIAEEIKPNALDIQPINDILGFMKKYGNTCTSNLQRPDNALFFNPDTTIETIKAKAREYVDVFGAGALPGSGVVLNQNLPDAEKANEFWNEIYRYSLEQYRKL